MKSFSGGLLEFTYSRNKAYAVFDRSVEVAIVSSPSGLSTTMTLLSSNMTFSRSTNLTANHDPEKNES